MSHVRTDPAEPGFQALRKSAEVSQEIEGSARDSPGNMRMTVADHAKTGGRGGLKSTK